MVWHTDAGVKLFWFCFWKFLWCTQIFCAIWIKTWSDSWYTHTHIFGIHNWNHLLCTQKFHNLKGCCKGQVTSGTYWYVSTNLTFTRCFIWLFIKKRQLGKRNVKRVGYIWRKIDNHKTLAKKKKIWSLVKDINFSNIFYKIHTFS